MRVNKINIGVDLDGIFVDKPPLVPARLINYLYRDESKTKLTYKIPRSILQRTIRRSSHVRILRPTIKENIKWLQERYKKNDVTVEIISGRYGFLEGVSKSLLLRNNLSSAVKHLWINYGNEQPHLFKENIIRKKDIKYFVDDDIFMLNYLAAKFPAKKFFWYSKSPYFHEFKKTIMRNNKNIKAISSLRQIEDLI